MFRFAWEIDGKQVSNNEFEMVALSPNRCLSRFRNAKAGKYTIHALNEFGSAKSSGYVNIAGN